MSSRRIPGWWSKLNSSKVLEAGKLAARIRSCAPEAFAGGDFSVEDGDQVVLVGPAGVSGLAGETDGGLTDPGRLQCSGKVADLLG